MPIYEYRCGACGHKMELLQKLTDAPLLKCPSCSKEQLRKLISAAGFRLKGGGWYETDFKSGNKRNLVTSGDNATKEKEASGKDNKDKDKSGTSAAKPKSDSSAAAAS